MKPFKPGECFVREFQLAIGKDQPSETLVIEFPLGATVEAKEFWGHSWPRKFKLVSVEDEVTPDMLPKMEFWQDR